MDTNAILYLIAELLDVLAGRDRPASTSDLSMTLTSAMRRLVSRGVVKDDDVMTWNTPHGYWEVTGATVTTILEKQPEVVMTGKAKHHGHGRVENHWAMKANAERWEKEREAREELLVEADTRFTINESPVQGVIRVLDTTRFGKVNSPDEAAVAIFDTDALPLDVARDLAQRAKRALVRLAVA